MYTREETSKIKTQFWTSFGQYLKPIAGASGMPVNWINYKTGIKHIRFKMDADDKTAYIAIEISHPQEEQRSYCYDKFLSLKKILDAEGDFNWLWYENWQTGHHVISCISCQLDRVNVLNQSTWPAIISFLKPRMIALDSFWEMVREGFE